MSGKRGPETLRGETREQLTAHGAEAYRALQQALTVRGLNERMAALEALVHGKSVNQRNAVIGAMFVYLAGLPPSSPPPAPRAPEPPRPSAPGAACGVLQEEVA